MYYVQRDKNGMICGVFANPQPQADGTCLTDPIALADNNPEVLSYLAKPIPDPSDLNNMDKAMKVIVLLIRQYTNAIRNGTFSGSAQDGTKTISDVRSDFMALYRALP